jgi:hypothetical protein
VHFVESAFTNSNELPKEWMEAFGASEELTDSEANLGS